MTTPLFLQLTSGFLVATGLFTLLLRRNSLVLLMGIELILNGVNLAFITAARQWAEISGQVFVFFVMAVAAAEAAVGLALLIQVYRQFGSVTTADTQTMKG